MLRYRVWIAPVVPALTHATPDEVIGFEDAAFALEHARTASKDARAFVGPRLDEAAH